MKLLQFETIQPKGLFIIPETNFVCYKSTVKMVEERGSGTLTYKSGAKTLSVEVKHSKPKVYLDTNAKAGK